MTITENKELIFTDFEEKTQCVSIETIKEMWKAYKKSKEPVQTSCANYDRDNCPEIPDTSVGFLNIAMDFFNTTRNTINSKINTIEFDGKNGNIGFTVKDKCEDPIVESVRQKLLDRCSVGIKKYNTTLKSNNKDNYLKHAQEEAMDLSNYLEKLMQQKEDITQIVAKYPNNMELGEKIRKIYGK